MKFELPELPYSLDALEPKMSVETMRYHYGKHHQTYINNLNELIKGSQFQNSNLEDMIERADGAIFNNAAQTWNHTFFFTQFSPKPHSKPAGHLEEAINRDFGSFSNFKELFSKAAVTLFGSGWAWLSEDAQGHLHISQESNAGNPLRSGLKPILTCDVWEHSYYIDYKNLRADYVKTFWELVDWSVIDRRYK